VLYLALRPGPACSETGERNIRPGKCVFPECSHSGMPRRTRSGSRSISPCSKDSHGGFDGPNEKGIHICLRVDVCGAADCHAVRMRAPQDMMAMLRREAILPIALMLGGGDVCCRTRPHGSGPACILRDQCGHHRSHPSGWIFQARRGRWRSPRAPSAFCKE
jgi:hypothetical protein